MIDISLSEELRIIADIADAGDKPHWAASIRAAITKLHDLQRELDSLLHVKMTDDQIMKVAEQFSVGSAVLCRSGSLAFARAICGVIRNSRRHKNDEPE